MNYIDKYSKYALAIAVITIAIMIFLWPKSPITSDEYKERAAQLQQEKQELLKQRALIEDSIDKYHTEIGQLKRKDSLLRDSFNRNKQTIAIVKQQYEKIFDSINRYSSDDLVRYFSELKER